MDRFYSFLNQLWEKDILINPPRKQILLFLLVLLVILFFLICFSYSVFSYITLFLLLNWGFVYYQFVQVWVSFRYSRLLIHVFSLAVALSAFLLGSAVRRAISVFLNFIINEMFI